MSFGLPFPPKPLNEPVLNYEPGSSERENLQLELTRQKSRPVEIPLFIGGEEVKTGETIEVRCPHDHKTVLAIVHQASPKHVEMAIKSCLAAQKEWRDLSWEHRASIFLKAAALIAGPYRAVLNAATMLGQSKTVIQAEIDSACELIDFLRFNVSFMMGLAKEQPPENSKGIWNRLEYRPLEGFVYAVTPFNFTAIAGNLPTCAAMLGNVSLWKPAQTSMLSSYYFMRILQEAGLPAGVINLVSGDGKAVSDQALNHRDLAGVHFTGSTPVFQSMWQTIGNLIGKNHYRSYPRIVGETGGKDFVFAYQDAHVKSLSTALVRGAFEYQGQKCSAASRAYIPRSLWPQVESEVRSMLSEIKVGDVCDFSNFMGAVIDKRAYQRLVEAIEYAKKQTKEAKVIVGGEYSDETGYFIQPTIILTTNPKFRTMEEELFGPVLTIFVYEDQDFEKTLALVDETSPYALTGAVFAKNRMVIEKMTKALVNAAGNFYINDKPTGAVVGQQPFGGARSSGTNDKAGSPINLLRWLNLRTVKETFEPIEGYRYPYMK